MTALCPILGSEQKNKVNGSSKYYLYYDKIKVGGGIGYYKNKYKQNKAKQIGLPVDPRIRKTISALRGVGPGQDPHTFEEEAKGKAAFEKTAENTTYLQAVAT